MKAYRRRGAAGTTRRLVAALTACELADGTLLDVGAGCGALAFELLQLGMSEATCVDPAPAYREVALEEAARRGLERRVRRWLVAPLNDVATRLRPADVVTLDRVVCCDADPSALVATAADLSRRAVALSYPRDVRWVRIATALGNWWRRRRSVAQTFVHPERTLVGPLRDAGFRLATQTDTAFWRIAVYERACPARVPAQRREHLIGVFGGRRLTLLALLGTLPSTSIGAPLHDALRQPVISCSTSARFVSVPGAVPPLRLPAGVDESLRAGSVEVVRRSSCERRCPRAAESPRRRQ